MNYLQTQDYLNSFINYEVQDSYPYKSLFKLKRIARLLEFIGNPHQGLRAIHIAGTKGKGSTCAFTANILAEAGFKVGLYTSPHLVDVRERIVILQPLVAPRSSLEKEGISRKNFARLIEKIRPYAEKLRNTDLGRLSYYEVLTAMAFLYFKEEKCDYVVLETGMGGRLDATNLVSSLVCAITPISYEHRQVLGNTLGEIAAEKAGIIKRIVVSAPQRPAVLKVIKKRAQEMQAKLFALGRDMRIEQARRQVFTLQGIFGRYPRLKIGPLGGYQIINAAVAVGCVESLRNYGLKVSVKAIRKGLAGTSWPGRLQVISQKPRIVLDAAQNQASAFALKQALGDCFRFRRLILVLGVCRDKDVRGILKELLPLAGRVILTKTQNPRAMEPEVIRGLIGKSEKTVTLTQNAVQALKYAKEDAGRQDLVLVCGSIFLLGEILNARIGFK